MSTTNITLPEKYYEEGNQIYNEKLGQLTNGTIRIARLERRENGNESKLVVIAIFIFPLSNRETTVEIPLEAAKSSKVMKYLPEEFIILGLSEAKKRWLISECFSQTLINVPETQTFALSPGYNKVGEQYVYVLGDYLINPSGMKTHVHMNSAFHLLESPNPQSKYVYWLKTFWNLDRDTMPTLFLSVIASLIRPHLQEAGIDTGFVAYVNGETGNGKSTVVKLLTEIFKENNYWTVSSDLNDVRKKMAQIKDFVFLFDDLNKTETERLKLSKESKVSEIIQQAANYDTVGSDGENSSFHRIIILTAEYMLKNASTLNRCVLINLSSSLKMEMLGTLKEKKADYIFFLIQFIAWLCKEKNSIMDEIQKLSAIGLTQKTYNPQAYAGIARIERTEQILNISMELFLKFLQLPKEQENQCRKMFKNSIEVCIDDTRDMVRKSSEEHGREYVDVIINEFVISEHVAQSFKSYNKKRKTGENILFFRSNDCFCITGEDLKKLFENKLNFEYTVSIIAISKQLRWHGLLKIPYGEPSYPCNENKDKDKKRYYHIYVHRIVEMMTPDDRDMAKYAGAIKELRPSHLQNDDDYDDGHDYYDE